MMEQSASNRIDWDEAAHRLITAIERADWWIGQSGGLVVYRGFELRTSESTPVLFVSPRADRTPVDTHRRWHQLLDQYLQAKFGVPFRSNSLFCTGDPAVAQFYGNRYIVIPMGTGKYVWSPSIDDLANNPMFMAAPPESVTELDGTGFEQSYINSDLIDAIRSAHEIMINCSTAALFDADLNQDQLNSLTAALGEQGVTVPSSHRSIVLYSHLVQSIYG